MERATTEAASLGKRLAGGSKLAFGDGLKRGVFLGGAGAALLEVKEGRPGAAKAVVAVVARARRMVENRMMRD